ncbi:MAG: tetratricopeptide repeat protein [Ruminococcus sp.]|uniref:tetratricopeptide repeat protein n=1 Tax=Schaedlerella arabinosiphila TaxID=2044587 RepID=UPI002557F14D|nr:tetratricopeptide repeat protein [Schaedlerella arabinosiphila]MCI9603260.1 tetratricopeptide repeat protein [Ruminococcus sp.]MCI9632614.1 tetratricopeptide repeat protein [Ruminococcus sp.]
MRNRKIRYLVLSAALMCVLTACSKNGIKEGTELLEKGDFEKAATVFEQAAKEAETEGERAPEAYRGMGMACYALEDYEGTRQNLQKALDEGGLETPIIYNLIGVSSMKLEDYDTALAAFDKGTGLPESGVVSRGSKEEETADYSEVIREMKFNRVVCLEKKLDWENAKAAMAEYASLYPDDANAQKEAEFLSTR